jgi:hypothetical protein
MHFPADNSFVGAASTLIAFSVGSPAISITDFNGALVCAGDVLSQWFDTAF